LKSEGFSTHQDSFFVKENSPDDWFAFVTLLPFEKNTCSRARFIADALPRTFCPMKD